MSALRTLLAPNASPMTLDGTRTYIIGRHEAAVLDPGPADPVHIDALCLELRDAHTVTILLTHCHPDHAEGAVPLAEALDGLVSEGPAANSVRLPRRQVYGPTLPGEGDVFATDAGELTALATPGHTPDHVAVLWREERAIFCGDLMMGGLDTALVAAGEGELGAYLGSLERLRWLDPDVIYPAHGPPFYHPAAAILRYLEHRAERERQVLAALAGGARGLREIAGSVYGELAPELRDWVELTVRAYLEHLERTGRVKPEEWR